MAYALTEADDFAFSKIVLMKHMPSTWSDMSPETTVELVGLPSYSQEYRDVVNKIPSTLSSTVSQVLRVQNPYLWGAYLLRKEQYPSAQELKLFHATARTNVVSIATNNFDWRRTVRSKFGRGVSFSPSAEYADKYCNQNTGSERALILSRVAVGAMCSGSQDDELPFSGYDTTTGNRGKVYVKYNDNEFYPEYVAYYVNNNPYVPRRRGRWW